LVLHGPEPRAVGSSFGLGAAKVPIGREDDPPPAVVLDDPSASRHHAVVVRTTDHRSFEIHDLGSRNGTFVNGMQIESTPLSHGDIVRIGDHVMLFERLSMQDCELLIEARDPSSSWRGESVPARRIANSLVSLAPLADPVLVIGESGAGKERIAQELHRLSKRKGELVPVNCAAIPEALAEAELFGHAAGAFTGAPGARSGLFAAAEHGTLFLDEIGELPVPLQAKLLRALATGEIRRVGETKTRLVDVRVVAATHVDLAEAVTRGAFRGDLYSRLAAFEIQVPALRERRDDILGLGRELVGLRTPQLSPDAAEALVTYRWPYNVRELLQSLRRCLHASGGERVELDHLPEPIANALPPRGAPNPEAPAVLPATLRIPRDVVPSADDLRAVLEQFDGNVVRVAAFFGKDRRQIYRWAERLGVDLTSFRS
ncbi:MAG: sigma 54-interacting transcriptional regulator, partial [Myxococcota bacterium]